MRACWLVLGVLLLGGCSCKEPPLPMADVADIDRIEIRYEHTGWGVINETFVLVPVRRGGGFHLQGHYESTAGGVRAGEWPVTSTAVAQLLAALQERPWQRERAMREIAGGVRRSELIPATFWTTWPPLACDADELRALARSRLRGRSVRDEVDAYYGTGMRWTDDDPYVQLRILHRQGREQRWHSTAQHAMLVPWVAGDDAPMEAPDRQNWSLSVSRTLRALVPVDAHLHARLDGLPSMRARLQDYTQYAAARECERLHPR